MVTTTRDIINKINSYNDNNLIIKTNNYEYIIDNINSDNVINIKVNMEKECVNHLLTSIMAELRDRDLFHPSFTYSLPFNSRNEIPKFNRVLECSNLNIQLIFYNMDNLNEKDQKLFNELYNYHSPNFRMISCIKEDFITYDLSGERYLTENSDYEIYTLAKDKILIK